MEEQVPHKQFYTIGEVSRITGVRPHVLRYWESRGKILRPTRRKSRHRLYRPADIRAYLRAQAPPGRGKDDPAGHAAPAQGPGGPLSPHPGTCLRSRRPPPFPRCSHPVLALLQEIRRELLDLKELLE